MQRIFPLVLAIWLVLISGAAWSVDGVLEINQTCAVQTGCFSGDSAGFPVTITSGGSYRLTGSLSATDTAVQALADNVTIDLNGFTIDFTGAVPTPVGIEGPFNTFGTVVRNGHITGFQSGIDLTPGIDCIIEQVRVRNGNSGIRVGRGSILKNNIARDNTGAGFFIQGQARVLDNVSKDNNIGFSYTCPTVLTGNLAVGNALNFTALGAGCSCANNAPAAPCP